MRHRTIACKCPSQISYHSHYIPYFSRALALSSSLGSGISRDECDIFKELTILQRRFCKENIELMPSVIRGSMLALKECQHQFRWRRWNCSTINKWKKRQNSPFGLALKSGKSLFPFIFLFIWLLPLELCATRCGISCYLIGGGYQ